MTFTPDQAADEFSVLLERAGAQVLNSWFLPAASGWKSIDLYRERVYCYELYHQLRVLTSPSSNRFAAAGYLVSGEMDKAGLNNVVVGGVQKPDFIWHIPGGDSNATVVEVKSVAAEGGHSKDIETLAAFVTAQPAYARGIYLFFGEEPRSQSGCHGLDCACAIRLAGSAEVTTAWCSGGSPMAKLISGLASASRSCTRMAGSNAGAAS